MKKFLITAATALVFTGPAFAESHSDDGSAAEIKSDVNEESLNSTDEVSEIEDDRSAEVIARINEIALNSASTTAQTKFFTEYDARRNSLQAPEVTVEGYLAMPQSRMTVAELEAANVYGADGEKIGEIEEAYVGVDGRVHRVTVEVGEYLGLDAKPVNVRLDELMVVRNSTNNRVRVYMDNRAEVLMEQPTYER